MDGEDTTPDRLSDHPTDQAASWLDQFDALPEKFPAALRCDVYDGPGGHGYVVTVRGVLGGVTWERSHNVGPETHRTAAWHQVAD